MKVWRFTICLIYATFLIKNANSVDEPGQGSKLYKTFDEIFGKGWDAEVPEFTETKEWHKMETPTKEVENKSTDQDNPNEQSFSDHFESFANRKIRERFDEMFDENWSEDDNEFIKEVEADSTDQNDCIDEQECQKVQENGTKAINVYSVLQKREIVEKFISLIEKYKQKGKHSQKERNLKYTQIAHSIGVSLRTILKWKKELDLSRNYHSHAEKGEKLKQYCEIKKGNPKIKEVEIAEILNIGGKTLNKWKRELKNAVKDEKSCSLQKELDQISQLKVYSDQQKREIIQKFREMKDNYRENNKHAHSDKEWNQIERNISNGLGVGRSTIYKWIKKLGLNQEKFSEFEKRQILKQFGQIKIKCKKAKLKNILMNELDEKIAKKLGVSSSTIYNWKSEFGLSVSNINNATKIGILKKYAKIKGKNPKINDCDIADLLKVSISSLTRWKSQFREEIKNL